ncbi:AdoMet dependent proline di-methyltransferase-domain-containing protein [Cladorrhinum sp. PSN259]|nr:AdoMet dependent proline di-methyltransferase-domain-containing protein [Cladorrhinum sp. PSN259]
MTTTDVPEPLAASVSNQDGGNYWDGVDADVNGMLGGIPSVSGYSHISKVDLQGSRSFLAKLGIGRKNGRHKVANALEGGAGIGRVTNGLLLEVADQVDVIEPVIKFTDIMRGTPGVRNIFNVGLDDWRPSEGVQYDLIWTQWCVGHLTDEQLVGYLKRCGGALNPDGGIIVIKENLSTSGSDYFDDVDRSITREDSKFLSLFEEAGLRIIRTEMQKGIPGSRNYPSSGAGLWPRSTHEKLPSWTAPQAKGEEILHVPLGCIRSLHTIPERISSRLPPNISIHALLAAELAMDSTVESRAWRDTLPTLADFEATTPFMWHQKLQQLLPKPARDLVKRQEESYHRDWDMVATAFPDLRPEDYQRSWFTINTRTFYYVTPQMEKYPPGDRLALVPVADFFNHADSGCEVTFSSEGFVVTADRGYYAGQEVYISYGEHTNDFLLAEYGFMLEENRWDKVCLDDVILPKLDATQKALLEGGGLLTPFMLDIKTLGCEKTQAALRLLCSCSRGQRHETLDAEGCGEKCAEKANELLMSLLKEYLDMVREAVQDVEGLQIGQSTQRELLARRWRQVEAIVTQAIKRLETL